MSDRSRGGDTAHARIVEGFAEVLDILPDLLFRLDGDGVFLDYHTNTPESLLVPPEEFLDRTIEEVMPPPLATLIRGHFDEAMRSSRIQVFEYTIPSPRGPAHFEARLARSREQDGALVIIRDVTERVRAQEALRRERDFVDSLLQTSPVFFVAIAPDGRTMMVNETLLDETGRQRDQVVGVDYMATFVPEDERAALGRVFSKLIEAQGPTVTENHVLTADGRKLLVEWHGRPVLRPDGTPEFFFGVGIDITERRRTERALARAQNLESLGLLAGGIAHDFNNILTGVLGTVSLVRTAGGDPERQQARLAEAEKALARAGGLTRQLLTFAKGGAPVLQAVRLADLLDESLPFCLSGSNVTVELDLPDDLSPVDGDAGQLGQVVQNLVINADQAMLGGGKLTIRAADVTLERGDVPPLRSGRYVRIELQDEGPGIEPADVDRIFDPYFTTKPRGTGLGLAVTWSVIRSHDGHVSVRSGGDGEGTTFVLWLPASDREVVVHEQTAAPRAPRGSRILLMDDEEVIRSVALEMLTEAGFAVSVARDGREAVAIWRAARADGVPFDLVILDLTVPGGAGGLETLSELRRLDPDVKALVSSGYSTSPAISGHLEHGFVGSVAKPYTFAQLMAAVGEALAPVA
jgi:two-component system, cell cycle sensor histidine kinase and response regulator CckA